MRETFLWLIKTDRFGYDDFDGFVVRAPDEGSARKIAQRRAEWQKGTFDDPKYSSCRKIGTATGRRTGIVLDSFNAG